MRSIGPPSRKRNGSSTLVVVIVVLALFAAASIFIFIIFQAHEHLDTHSLSSGGLKELFVTNKYTRFVVAPFYGHQAQLEPIRNEVPPIALSSIDSSLHPSNIAKSAPSSTVLTKPIVNSQYNASKDQVHIIPPSSRQDAETKKTTIPHHKLTCPHNELVTFWRAPTLHDLQYKTPFTHAANEEIKYVTFEPDVGGWNNIRMQMELVLVFAFATDRTLVLPPDQPMYLLQQGKGHQKAHGFIDFFPFDFIKQRMKVISMEEYLTREAISGKLKRTGTNEVLYPPGKRTSFVATERDERLLMWEYLRNVSSCPKWQTMTEFLVIPPGPGITTKLLPPSEANQYEANIIDFAANRTAVYYDDYWQAQKVVHFISKPGQGYRLLEHFYTYIHFQDAYMDRYFKRFVRDHVHYMDLIFCKAALIINKLLHDGNGSYNSFHIRRGEFQYNVVKIPAEKILNNLGNRLSSNSLVYVASDERNKTFFNAFRQHYKGGVRFLEDFVDLADLKAVNPNYLGMIDQVICTRGQQFVGTWFSTFSGYITRMRGYMGYSDTSVWYGDKEHRDRFQKPEHHRFPFYMREFSHAWTNIDEKQESG